MPNKYLTDVAIIRPALMVLLVFYHAFTIFSGAWEPIEGFPEIKAYWWVDKLAYAFMLETFVFLSGYVFGYQIVNRGGQINLKPLVLGKLKRLIVPSIIFSLFYEILLIDTRPAIPYLVYNVLNGIGHMWFLPMLFWCFVLTWLIERLKLSPKWAMSFLFVLTFASVLPLPLRLGISFYYMPFFYGAYLLKKHKVNLSCFYTRRNAILLAVIFVATFIVLTLLVEYVEKRDILPPVHVPMAMRMIKLWTQTLARLIYSCIGLMMLMIIVGLCNFGHLKQPPLWLITLGNLCMGVYLFQQFILKGVYYHTDLPIILGPYWLPWVGFILTVTVSVLLACLFRLTRVGRFLIG